MIIAVPKRAYHQSVEYPIEQVFYSKNFEMPPVGNSALQKIQHEVMKLSGSNPDN